MLIHAVAVCCLLIARANADPAAFVEVDGPVLRVSSPPGGIVLINEVDLGKRTQMLQDMYVCSLAVWPGCACSRPNTVGGTHQ